MRIDMRILIDYKEYQYAMFSGVVWKGNPLAITLTTEQARALRNQITKHLRGTRDGGEEVSNV